MATPNEELPKFSDLLRLVEAQLDENRRFLANESITPNRSHSFAKKAADQACLTQSLRDQVVAWRKLLESAPDETNPVALDEFNFTYHCGNIPNCQPLRVFRDYSNRNFPRITSAWQLSRAALDQVVSSGGVVYLSVLQPEQPAVWLDGFHGITPELQQAAAFPNGGEPLDLTNPDNLQTEAARAQKELASAFIAGLLRSLGYEPALVLPEGVFVQPHVDNIGAAALAFFSLHPTICTDETLAAICGRNDTLFRGMEGYAELRQALDAWRDDETSVSIVVGKQGEADAAVASLVAEALAVPHNGPTEYALGQYLLDDVSQRMGLGLHPTKGGNLSTDRLDGYRSALQGAAAWFFKQHPKLNQAETLEIVGKTAWAELAPPIVGWSNLEGFDELLTLALHWRAYLATDGRELLDVLLDTADAQKAAGNDLPPEVLADMALATPEAQQLLAVYIDEYRRYYSFPAKYWIDDRLFTAWYKDQPFAVGVGGAYLAAIQKAARTLAEKDKPKRPDQGNLGDNSNDPNDYSDDAREGGA